MEVEGRAMIVRARDEYKQDGEQMQCAAEKRQRAAGLYGQDRYCGGQQFNHTCPNGWEGFQCS